MLQLAGEGQIIDGRSNCKTYLKMYPSIFLLVNTKHLLCWFTHQHLKICIVLYLLVEIFFIIWNKWKKPDMVRPRNSPHKYWTNTIFPTLVNQFQQYYFKHLQTARSSHQAGTDIPVSQNSPPSEDSVEKAGYGATLSISQKLITTFNKS